MSEDTIEVLTREREDYLVQPSNERTIVNVGEGQLITQEDFKRKLQNPNTELWFRGEKRELREIEPKDALEALGVWENGDLILATKKGYTTKASPYYNVEKLGLGTEEEIRRKLKGALTVYAHVVYLEYIPENIGIRGEAYVDRKTGLVLARIYSHEGEEWENQVDKEHAIFHEIGHGVYSQLTPEEKSQWESLFTTEPNIGKLAQEIARERREENLLEEALKDEVFADTFASLASASGEEKNNFQNKQPELCQLMQKYIRM